MKVGAIQFDCLFGEKEHNLNRVGYFLKNNSSDLWVLPELFNTGYLFSSTKELESLAECIPGGNTTQSLIKMAQHYKTTIVAGIAERENDFFYNAAVCVNESGFIAKYRKIHLFDREKLWFQPGNIPFEVHNLGNVTIGMMICFDWIFPEAARSLALKGAQIICHPANLVLPYCQKAMVTRCLENRVFAITANRIGTEAKIGMKLDFTGMSEIVSPKGEILFQAQENSEEAGIVDIDPALALDKKVTATNHILADRRTELYVLK